MIFSLAMSADDSLPDDVAILKAMLRSERAARLAAEAEAQTRTLLIEKLKLTIKRLRHEQFGQSSERGALPPPSVPLGIFHALCRFSSAFRPSNNPLPDRPPSSRYRATPIRTTRYIPCTVQIFLGILTPPPIPPGLSHALRHISQTPGQTNRPRVDRPPQWPRYGRIGSMGLWCGASCVGAWQYSPALPDAGNSADRQAEDRQGWPAKTGLGAAARAAKSLRLRRRTTGR